MQDENAVPEDKKPAKDEEQAGEEQEEDAGEQNQKAAEDDSAEVPSPPADSLARPSGAPRRPPERLEKPPAPTPALDWQMEEDARRQQATEEAQDMDTSQPQVSAGRPPVLPDVAEEGEPPAEDDDAQPAGHRRTLAEQQRREEAADRMRAAIEELQLKSGMAEAERGREVRALRAGVSWHSLTHSVSSGGVTTH